jgi:hypothetical protein
LDLGRDLQNLETNKQATNTNIIKLLLKKIGPIINIISFIFLSIIISYFIWDLRMVDIFVTFIFSIISFSISMYISDNFKLSNSLFIKFLQKLVFTSIILASLSFWGYLLDVSNFPTLFCDGDSDDEYSNSGNTSSVNSENKNNNEEESLQDIARITTNKDETNAEYYNFKFKKDIVDNIVEKGKNLTVGVVTDIAPNLGIGAAVGKVASEVFRHTGGMAPVPRVAMVGSTALATAAGTKIGIELGRALMVNKNMENNISSSPSSPKPSLEKQEGLINIDGRDSPTEFGSGFIQSVLEESEIPLITIVNGLCFLNYIEFSLILSLFLLLFRKYLISKIIGFILSLKNKEVATQGNTLSPKKTNTLVFGVGSLKKSLNTSDKYTDILIAFIFLCLFWIKFINIYYSSSLAGDIDSFVNVYNHIKSQSFGFLLFSLKNESLLQKDKLCYNKAGSPEGSNFVTPTLSLKRSDPLRRVNKFNPSLGWRRELLRFRISHKNTNKYHKTPSSIQRIQRWFSTNISTLSLSYDLNSPIFKELLSILSNNPINQETQVKIEHFLQNQANQALELESNKLKLNTNESSSTESRVGEASKISKTLISKLVDKKPSLKKIINNYKINLTLMEGRLSSLNIQIINNLDINFLVNIIYGRILTIISNNQLLNNKTYQVDVTIDLGKEMVNKYILGLYKKVKESNPNITFTS